MTTTPESTPDDGRPGDDPDQTPWHFGARFMMFWVAPSAVVACAFVWWEIIETLRAGGELVRGSRSLVLLVLYPVAVVGWVGGLVAYRRAKRRGETPVRGSSAPRRSATRR